MEALTGVKEYYSEGFYLTPEGKNAWISICSQNDTKIVADGNVRVAIDGSKLIKLNEAISFLSKKSKPKIPQYEIILSEETLKDLLQYKSDLLSGNTEPGGYFKHQLDVLPKKNLSLDQLTTKEFLQILLLSKQYEYFAGEVVGDGSDWNSREFQILGEISVTMKVIVYDNGVWKFTNDFKEHDPPMVAHLIYTPGPLLVGRFRGVIPDFEAVSINGKISQEKYYTLMERRLLPIFLYAEEKAKQEKKNALIVVPGLGCGIFAKDFKGQMGEHLNKALQSIIKNLPPCENIACIRYDPYDECEDFEEVIGSVKFRLRRSTGPLGKPQLSRVEDFEEVDGEFENCILFKVVAWDHVAYPGNNYFLGVRYSDDGVAGAATNTMEVLTGVKGHYAQGFYLPPEGNKSRWINVASSNNTKLIAEDNVKIAVNGCELVELSEYEPS